MKKSIMLLLVAMTISSLAFAEGQQEAGAQEGPWTPTKNVEWMCTSSAGGGSSIFTQTIIGIIQEQGLVDKEIIINYKTDGGGAVGRRQVSRANSKGHTLLTFNSGDLQPLVQMENGDLDDFTPLAIMALDGQIILSRKGSDYQNAEAVIEALKQGDRIVMGGSKSDDEAIYNAMMEEIGGNMEYLRSDSTGEALTQLLGGHVDLAIAKPAASFDLVASGELVPVIAAGGSRFDEPFNAPTFTELGYDIEFQIYRGIVAPKSMPASAAAFWGDVFQKVAATEEWKKNYISKFLLVSHPLTGDDARSYMQKFEDIYTQGE